MTKAQFTSAEADLIHKLNPVVETLVALDEGRGTSFEVEAWNELHETERVLREELRDLRNDFAFSQSTGIIAISV
jgi:hypothetical protein